MTGGYTGSCKCLFLLQCYYLVKHDAIPPPAEDSRDGFTSFIVCLNNIVTI